MQSIRQLRSLHALDQTNLYLFYCPEAIFVNVMAPPSVHMLSVIGAKLFILANLQGF